jgi:hypothetical protein
MADLLEGSSKHMVDGQSSSSNSTPRLSQQFQPNHFQNLNNNNGQPTSLQPSFPSQPTLMEAMDTSKKICMKFN